MKKHRTIGLYAIAFGALELSLTCFLSGLIWIGSYVSNYILPTIINLTLLGITLIISLWQFFKRKNARSYLFGLLVRIFFAGSIFVLYQIGFVAFVPKASNYLWLIGSLIVYIYAVIHWFQKEKSVWNLTLDILQKSGKLNIKKNYFRIRGGFYSATDKPSNPNEKGALVGYAIVIGIVIFKILEWFLGKDFMTYLLKIGLFFGNYLTGLLFGKILLWTIEIRKLEKKLGIEFITEFGEIKDKKRVKLNRKLKKPLEP